MGKVQSAAGRLTIETEKPWFGTEETVRGAVRLQQRKSGEWSDLRMNFKRKEMMQMELHAVCGLRFNLAFYQTENKVEVAGFRAGHCAVGTYSFLFAYGPPGNLANSFLFSKSKGGCKFAFVRYRLSATLIAADGSVSKAKKEVEMLQPLAVPRLLQTKDVPPVCSKCGRAVQVVVRMELDKEAYSYSESIRCAIFSLSRDCAPGRVLKGTLVLRRDLLVSSGPIGFSNKKQIGPAKRFSYTPPDTATVLLPIHQKSVRTTPSLRSQIVQCDYIVSLRVQASVCCAKASQVIEARTVLYDPRSRL